MRFGIRCLPPSVLDPTAHRASVVSDTMAHDGPTAPEDLRAGAQIMMTIAGFRNQVAWSLRAMRLRRRRRRPASPTLCKRTETPATSSVRARHRAQRMPAIRVCTCMASFCALSMWNSQLARQARRAGVARPRER